ncbi:Zinc finger protein 598 [Nosema bombycis CQ1]|uniref:Zinc finger protein 598 n=1 Tax=Nosema bombycis (strain CQ1 / CVCC 102059) TaxID=578461 RepID=R0MBZ7_NOSB1|nr:Zinc finger protein 598 [Nosema bombycis CQ1]|eukprot:EOB11570.1 Zinc finger protein 598 [Nosema bombycis CQ1]
MLSLKCTECDYVSKNKYDLSKHYKSHTLLLCNECFENKKEFWWEFKTFKISTLKLHKNGKLNENGFRGHVFCIHCNIFIYDEPSAIRHCNITHVQCTICDILGFKYKYYSTFRELEQHYKNAHYCCDNKQCIQTKCYAFPYKTELFEHMTRFHKTNIKFSDLKSRNECDIPVMDPCAKSQIDIQNRQKVKQNVIDKNIREFSQIKEVLNNSNEIPDYLNRSIISKLNLNINTRKAIISRYINTSKDEVHKIIESTITKEKSIDECFEQISELVTPDIALKILKDINFESLQPEVDLKYKEFKNSILFPKFKSSTPPLKKIETSRSIGFKILDLKKSKK